MARGACVCMYCGCLVVLCFLLAEERRRARLHTVTPNIESMFATFSFRSLQLPIKCHRAIKVVQLESHALNLSDDMNPMSINKGLAELQPFEVKWWIDSIFWLFL